jgi:competence protein ComEC
MRKLLLFSLSFCLADILCVCWLPERTAFLLGALTALLALACFLMKGPDPRRAAICLLGLCAGLLWCAGYRAVFLRPAEKADGKTQLVTARVADYPQQTGYGVSVTADILLYGRPCRSLLYLDAKEASLEPGDLVTAKAELQLANGDIQKGDNTYYRSKGVLLLAEVSGKPQIQTGNHRALRDLPVRFGHLLKQTAEKLFAPDVSGFITALLTGDKSGLTEQQKYQLSDSGVYHTVAVSGMHVSILLGILLLFCGNRNWLTSAIGIPVVVFFILMVGGTPSAVRAGCMQIIFLLAPLFRRENDPPTSLAAALLFLLVTNPWSILNVGLQLSFASISGIFLFASKIYEPIYKSRMVKKMRAVRPLGWLVKTVLAAFSCSMASMVFAMPLTVWHFGVVSLIAPLTNILVLWCITLIFSAGLLITLLGLVFPPAAYGPAWLLGWLVRYVFTATGLLSRVPYAAVGTDNVYLAAWLVFFYLLVLGLCLAPRRFLTPAAGACAAVSLAVCLMLSYFDFHSRNFSFTALDVGQGQCLILNCGTDTTVIDCGSSRPAEAGETAARFLTARGEFQIERLILTHYDADHAGGVLQLLERCRVEEIRLPAMEDDTGMKALVLQKAGEHGCRIVTVEKDEELSIPGGKLLLFAPTSGKSDNDSGICVLASAAKYGILITGDLSEKGEYRLLSLHSLPDLQLLVAGHHGSADSTSQALLDAVRPETAIISVGENTYGHPAAQTIERIRAAGAEIFRTDECGNITIRG